MAKLKPALGAILVFGWITLSQVASGQPTLALHPHYVDNGFPSVFPHYYYEVPSHPPFQTIHNGYTGYSFPHEATPVVNPSSLPKHHSYNTEARPPLAPTFEHPGWHSEDSQVLLLSGQKLPQKVYNSCVDSYTAKTPLTVTTNSGDILVATYPQLCAVTEGRPEDYVKLQDGLIVQAGLYRIVIDTYLHKGKPDQHATKENLGDDKNSSSSGSEVRGEAEPSTHDPQEPTVVLPSGEVIPYPVYLSISDVCEKGTPVTVITSSGDVIPASTFAEVLLVTHGRPYDIVQLPNGATVSAGIYRAAVSAHAANMAVLKYPAKPSSPTTNQEHISSQSAPSSEFPEVSEQTTNEEPVVVLPSGETLPYSRYQCIVDCSSKRKALKVATPNGPSVVRGFPELLLVTQGRPNDLVLLENGEVVHAGTYCKVMDARYKNQAFLLYPSGQRVPLVHPPEQHNIPHINYDTPRVEPAVILPNGEIIPEHVYVSIIYNNNNKIPVNVIKSSGEIRTATTLPQIVLCSQEDPGAVVQLQNGVAVTADTYEAAVDAYFKQEALLKHPQSEVQYNPQNDTLVNPTLNPEAPENTTEPGSSKPATSKTHNESEVILPTGEQVPYTIYESAIDSYYLRKPLQVTSQGGNTQVVDNLPSLIQVTHGHLDDTVRLPNGVKVTSGTYRSVINAHQQNEAFLRYPSGEIVRLQNTAPQAPNTVFAKRPTVADENRPPPEPPRDERPDKLAEESVKPDEKPATETDPKDPGPPKPTESSGNNTLENPSKDKEEADSTPDSDLPKAGAVVILPSHQQVPCQIYNAIVDSYIKRRPVKTASPNGQIVTVYPLTELLLVTDNRPDEIVILENGYIVSAGIYREVVTAYLQGQALLQYPSGHIEPLGKNSERVQCDRHSPPQSQPQPSPKPGSQPQPGPQPQPESPQTKPEPQTEPTNDCKFIRISIPRRGIQFILADGAWDAPRFRRIEQKDKITYVPCDPNAGLPSYDSQRLPDGLIIYVPRTTQEETTAPGFQPKPEKPTETAPHGPDTSSAPEDSAEQEPTPIPVEPVTPPNEPSSKPRPPIIPNTHHPGDIWVVDGKGDSHRVPGPQVDSPVYVYEPPVETVSDDPNKPNASGSYYEVKPTGPNAPPPQEGADSEVDVPPTGNSAIPEGEPSKAKSLAIPHILDKVKPSDEIPGPTPPTGSVTHPDQPLQPPTPAPSGDDEPLPFNTTNSSDGITTTTPLPVGTEGELPTTTTPAATVPWKPSTTSEFIPTATPVPTQWYPTPSPNDDDDDDVPTDTNDPVESPAESPEQPIKNEGQTSPHPPETTNQKRPENQSEMPTTETTTPIVPTVSPNPYKPPNDDNTPTTAPDAESSPKSPEAQPETDPTGKEPSQSPEAQPETDSTGEEPSRNPEAQTETNLSGEEPSGGSETRPETDPTGKEPSRSPEAQSETDPTGEGPSRNPEAKPETDPTGKEPSQSPEAQPETDPTGEGPSRNPEAQTETHLSGEEPSQSSETRPETDPTGKEPSQSPEAQPETDPIGEEPSKTTPIPNQPAPSTVSPAKEGDEDETMHPKETPEEDVSPEETPQDKPLQTTGDNTATEQPSLDDDKKEEKPTGNAPTKPSEEVAQPETPTPKVNTTSPIAHDPHECHDVQPGSKKVTVVIVEPPQAPCYCAPGVIPQPPPPCPYPYWPGHWGQYTGAPHYPINPHIDIHCPVENIHVQRSPKKKLGKKPKKDKKKEKNQSKIIEEIPVPRPSYTPIYGDDGELLYFARSDLLQKGEKAVSKEDSRSPDAPKHPDDVHDPHVIPQYPNKIVHDDEGNMYVLPINPDGTTAFNTDFSPLNIPKEDCLDEADPTAFSFPDPENVRPAMADSEYIIVQSPEGYINYVPRNIAPGREITLPSGHKVILPVFPSRWVEPSVQYHAFTTPDGIVYEVPYGRGSGADSVESSIISIEKIETLDGETYDVPVETKKRSDGSITTTVSYNADGKPKFKTIIDVFGDIYSIPITGTTTHHAPKSKAYKTIIDPEGDEYHVPENQHISPTYVTIVDVDGNIYEIPSTIKPCDNIKNAQHRGIQNQTAPDTASAQPSINETSADESQNENAPNAKIIQTSSHSTGLRHPSNPPSNINPVPEPTLPHYFYPERVQLDHARSPAIQSHAHGTPFLLPHHPEHYGAVPMIVGRQPDGHALPAHSQFLPHPLVYSYRPY